VAARDPEMACALISACVSAHRQRPFLLDAPEHNEEFARRLEAAGFRRECPFMRMFRGDRPARGRPDLQFAIAGPEFG
jgi:hypothetical protein